MEKRAWNGALLILILASLGCIVGTGDSGIPDDFEVIYSSYANNAEWDGLSYHIYRNGTVMFHSQSDFDLTKGTKTIYLTEEELFSIYKSVSNNGFFELYERYVDSNVVDGGATRLIVTAENRTHNVVVENTEVKKFTAIVETIDNIIRLAEERGVETPPVGGGAPSLPISVGLSISNAPALGESAELTFTITSLFRYNVSNFSGRIILPEGLEHVSGNLSWEGDLLPNQTIQFSAVVKAVKTGTWLVRASPQAGYGDQLYLLISEDSAQVSKNPFPADSRSTSRRMAVSVNDTEIPSQPLHNYSGISEEPASPDQIGS